MHAGATRQPSLEDTHRRGEAVAHNPEHPPKAPPKKHNLPKDPKKKATKADPPEGRSAGVEGSGAAHGYSLP